MSEFEDDFGGLDDIEANEGNSQLDKLKPVDLFGDIKELAMSGKVTKADISTVVDARAEVVIDQGLAFQSLAVVKIMKEALAQFESAINDAAIDEAEKLGKEERVAYGLQATIKSGGKSYDYSGDEKLNALSEDLKNKQEELKPIVDSISERKELMKKYAGSVGPIELADGDKITPATIISYGATQISFPIKKA